MTESALPKDDYFFQMYGLNAQPPAALNAALAQAIQSMRRSVYAESAGELTEAELKVLEASGVDVNEHPELPDPLLDFATDFAAILTTSWTTTVAADRLGVHAVRIRQMIGDGTLYAVRVDGRWRILEFQFQDNRLVPNIGEVNAVIDRDLDAVSVLRWYTSPDPELESSDGTILSPLAWLKRGLSPEPVVQLARHL